MENIFFRDFRFSLPQESLFPRQIPGYENSTQILAEASPVKQNTILQTHLFYHLQHMKYMRILFFLLQNMMHYKKNLSTILQMTVY